MNLGFYTTLFLIKVNNKVGKSSFVDYNTIQEDLKWQTDYCRG